MSGFITAVFIVKSIVNYKSNKYLSNNEIVYHTPIKGLLIGLLMALLLYLSPLDYLLYSIPNIILTTLFL